jgi:hypothetical protein
MAILAWLDTLAKAAPEAMTAVTTLIIVTMPGLTVAAEAVAITAGVAAEEEAGPAISAPLAAAVAAVRPT